MWQSHDGHILWEDQCETLELIAVLMSLGLIYPPVLPY
jgi:hypothetical protein